MRMHNPPHPGEFIREVYFNAPDVDPLTIAAKLDVPPAALIRLLEGEASVTVEMVCRLSKTLVHQGINNPPVLRGVSLEVKPFCLLPSYFCLLTSAFVY
jgi:addiction module HigA family antidote